MLDAMVVMGPCLGRYILPLPLEANAIKLP